jgi:hypothetical protein
VCRVPRDRSANCQGVGQQVAQGLKVNASLPRIAQQLAEIIGHQNPFYFACIV